MKQEFYPVCVVPAVPNGEGIRFLHRKTQYDIDVCVEEIWALLAECNGYESSDVVIKRARKRAPDASEQIMYAILEDLRKLEVVVDSRQIFAHFHHLTSNPMHYSHSMSLDDIKAYTRSPRAPVLSGVLVELAEPTGQLSNLQDMRRSCRSFADDGVQLHEIAHILRNSYDITRHSVPSAGGLYPLKIYAIVINESESLQQGYYEYDPESGNAFRYCDEVDRQLLEYAFDSETLVHGAPLIIVVAGDMSRQSGKYSNRGYRYTLIEAGHVAQNMVLAASEVGLHSLEYGGFLDEVLGRELQMSEASFVPIISVAIGTKSDEPPTSSMYALDQLQKELVGKRKPVRYVRTSTGNRPDKGETFFGAAALYQAGSEQKARGTYLQRLAGGTASSAAHAQVKALAEAYERHVSSIVRVDRECPANALDDRWIDPRIIFPLSSQQLEALPHLQVFDPNVPWQWIQGTHAINGNTVWVPVDLVVYPLSSSTFRRKLCHEASSSGVAAHTSEELAITGAALELVERDAIMRSWYTRTVPNVVSEKSLSVHARRRSMYWRGEQRDVYVLDHGRSGVSIANVVIKSDTEFPCFINGSAASLVSFDEAVSKAFHEAELALLHALKFKPHRPIKPEHVVHPLDHAKLYAFPKHLGNLEWLWSGAEVSAPYEPNLEVEQMLDMIDAIVVRLSEQNAPLHVVRVLSEKLVPVSFGYGMDHIHGAIREKIHPHSLSLPHYFA